MKQLKIPSSQLLDELKAEVSSQLQFIHQKVEGLGVENLNKRPAENKWSILECIEHMNRYGDFYLREFSKSADSGKDIRKENFKSSALGNYFVRTMLPMDGVVSNKMHTVKSKNPKGSVLDQEVIRTHIEQQQKLLGLFETLKEKDLNRNKVPTTLGNWLKLKLGDSMRFYVAHMTRHYVQIQNLLS